MAIPGGRGGSRGGAGGIGGLENLYAKVTKDRPDTARSLNVKSVLALENNRLGEAAELAGRAIAMDPSEPVYLIHMAKVCARAGWWGEAANALRRVLFLEPRDADSWYGLGIAFEQMEQPDHARFCWEQCIVLDPGHREALKALGRDEPALDIPAPPPPFMKR